MADQLRVPTSAGQLAAHARALAAPSGEHEVMTGLAARGARVLPCRLDTGAVSWRALVTDAGRVEADLRRHAGFPVEELVGEPGLPRQDHPAPRTPAARRLAVVWATVLGVDEDRIGREHDVFEAGATSLTAVKLAVAPDRAVSLSDITGHPVLADLADGRSAPRTGLLQSLSEPDAADVTGTLMCFPPAGGNAANFRPLARALRGSGLAVHAVEPPGHDPAADAEPFSPLGAVVEQVVAEITARGLPGVQLWGHSSRAAVAELVAGHHFPRTGPADAARAVLRAGELTASS